MNQCCVTVRDLLGAALCGCLEKRNEKCLCSSVFIRQRNAKGSCEELIDIVGFY